jgi:hypothetical protein
MDICPQYPVNIFSPWSAMIVTNVWLIKASTESLLNVGNTKANAINATILKAYHLVRKMDISLT